MIDVRLVYPLEKLESASRLADAIAAEGYSLERRALADSKSFPNLASEAASAKVLILIWSRNLISAAAAAGCLSEARRASNLVEVSADGIEPSSGAEISPVVLLCGWRGQPFHPGWRRIVAEIERLCGPGAASDKRLRAGPPPSGSPEAGTAAAPRSKAPPVRAAVAAGALIAATLGAAAFLNGGGSDTRPAPARPPVAALAPPSEAGMEVLAPEAPASAPARLAAQLPPGDPPTAAAPSIPPGPSEGASAPKPARGAEIRPQRSGSPKRLAAAGLPERVKRYSRKYSKTMRLFCQRSGRSTPQCRTFARSMRDLRG